MNEHNFDSLPPIKPTTEQPAGLPNEAAAASSHHETDASRAVEQNPAGGFVDPSGAGTPSSSGQSMAIPSATPAAPSVSTALIADDTDLIEKEWVEKAKHIVEQTKHDPHQQNQEINKVKADYLKKRYNHDLKVGKDS